MEKPGDDLHLQFARIQNLKRAIDRGREFIAPWKKFEQTLSKGFCGEDFNQCKADFAQNVEDELLPWLDPIKDSDLLKSLLTPNIDGTSSEAQKNLIILLSDDPQSLFKLPDSRDEIVGNLQRMNIQFKDIKENVVANITRIKIDLQTLKRAGASEAGESNEKIDALLQQVDRIEIELGRGEWWLGQINSALSFSLDSLCEKSSTLGLCRVVSLVRGLNELEILKRASMDSPDINQQARKVYSNSMKVHAFLMIVKQFDFEENYEDDDSAFRSNVLFLGELLDAATGSDNSEGNADAVARTIDAFIDEELVYKNKRQRKKNKCYFRLACWRKTLFLTSYFGFNKGLNTGSDSLESDLLAFGPVGFEIKLKTFENGNNLGVNFSFLDFGNAISNELKGVDSPDHLSAIGSKSIFATYTFKRAPFSILMGRQYDVIESTGTKKKDPFFIGVSFDLPLLTIF